jgi:hypothetical protein
MKNWHINMSPVFAAVDTLNAVSPKQYMAIMFGFPFLLNHPKSKAK